ncbi:MAG: hypothetical protein Q7W51_01565 [Coriobacteriia bacterium]|nr:hypothetical protein [Coriobacteriia bacterium]
MSRNRLRGLAATVSAIILLSGLVIVPGVSATEPYSIEQKVTEAGTSHYGISTAVSGTTAIVGSYWAPQAAYVYVRSGDTWTKQQTITHTEGSASDMFGFAVDIDGDTLVIGAPQHEHSALLSAGAAYVYVRSGSTWSLQQKLVATDAGTYDFFGHSVSLQGDTVVIGAAAAETTEGDNRGAAYVFTRSGSTWTQTQKLTAAGTTAPGLADDSFGHSVALSGDRIAVGAPYADPNGEAFAGRVYTYARSGGTWSFDEHIQAATPVTYHYVGRDIALDGATLLVGAFGGPGAANMYVDTASGWTLQQTLLQPDYTPGSYFGYTVDLYGDTAVIDAQYADGGSVQDAGAVYVFTRSGSTWTYLKTLYAADGALSDRLGACAVGPGVVTAGAEWGASATGKAYFFSTPTPPVTLAPVYRFYNFTNNTHFFTSSLDEANSVILNYPKVFRYEGICYYTNPANNTQPLYRFYNRVSASHFYTASLDEANHILATWPHIFTLDGQTYAVNPAPVPNSVPVYRFFNLTNGSHFYTSSAEEADMVIATWPTIYSYEGPAFWIGQ